MRYTAVAVVPLLLAACSVDLSVDKAAKIVCHSDAQCPPEFRCKADLGMCVIRTTNGSPTVALEPIARQVSSVALTLTVIDPEGDPVTITGELSVDGGPFTPIVLPTTPLAASPSGTTATVAWDALPVLGAGVHVGLVVRLTPSDGTTSGASITSTPFVFGNTPPVVTSVEVLSTAGVASGRVDVRVTLADATSDPCTLTAVELSVAGDFSDAVALDATSLPGATLAGLETSPIGVTHTVTWDTGPQAPVRTQDVRLRARVHDAFDPSAPTSSEPFAVDNAPSLVVTTPAPAGGGRFLSSVTIPVTTRDPNGDAVSVGVELSVDGVTFAPASATGATALASSAAGLDHTVRWTALADTGGALQQQNVDSQGNGVLDTPVLVYAPAVTLRLTPTDATGLVGSPVVVAPIALGNNPPAAAPSALAAVVSGEVPLGVALTDVAGDTADLEVAFSTDGGSTWRAAALALGATEDLATDAGGRLHVVVWDSTAAPSSVLTQPQGVGRSQALVQLRVRASDQPASQVRHYGAWAQTSATVRNQTPPQVIGLDARRAATLKGRSPVTITYRISDEESDPVDVQVLYSADGGRSFVPCDEYPSRVSEGLYDLATAPVAGGPGLLHTFVWDPGALLELPVTVTIRVEATDGKNPTPSSADALVGDTLSGGATSLAGSAFAVATLPLTTPGGWAAYRSVADDFDGNGVVDLAVLNDLQPVTVLVYRGAAGSTLANIGSFSAYTQYQAAGVNVDNFDPNLTYTDVNDDGARDLLFTSASGVGWFQNLGNGSFGAFASLLPATGGWSGFGCVVDITGDGKADLVLTQGDLNNQGPGSIGLFVGAGGGAFAAAPVVTAVPRTPRRCLRADLNHDGTPELVTDAWGSFALFHGDASGALTAAGSINVYSDMQATVVTDVNGDGIDDLVFPKPVQTSIGIVLGAASGTYPLLSATTSDNAYSLGVLDLDGDGAPDIITGIVEVLRQTSTSGVFAGGAGLGMSARTVAVRPATGGQPPIALLVTSAMSVVAVTPAKQPGVSGFGPVAPLSASQNTFGLVALDATHDGRTDLVAGSVFAVGLFEAGGSAPAGDGSFGAVTFPVKPYYLSATAAADVDGDGLLDLIIPGSIQSQFSVALGRLPGTPGYPFVPRLGAYASAVAYTGQSCAAAGDLDGDGVPEVLYAWPSATGHGELYVAHVGTNALTVAAPITIPQPVGIAVGDLNGDGHLDVLVSSAASNALVPLLNNGTGTLVAGTPLATPVYRIEGGATLTVDDLDDDGDLDAVYAHLTDVRVALGNGDGTFTAGAGVTPPMSTQYTDVTVADVDGDGAVDLVISGTNGISVALGITSSGVATGTFAAPVLVVSSGTESWHAPVFADLNGDDLPDLAATTLAGPRFALAEQTAFFAPASRGLSPVKRTGTQLLAPGVTAVAGVDRFGAAHRPPRVTYQVLRDGLEDFRARARRFIGTEKRRVPIGPPVKAEGDLAFRRVADATGARLAPTARLGLDLTTAARGVVVPLPIYAGRTGLNLASGTVIVVRQTTSFASSSGLLPQETTTTSVIDEVIPTMTLTTIPRGASLSTGTGSRFVVVTGATPEVQVLTDELGVFQAYFEP